MNEYTANNSSEMLNLLFDGELDSTMETQLYASLLENEDLRTELRELINIREAVHKDTEAFALPAVATQNVFSKLGFNPIGKSVSQNTVSIPWYKKLWNPVVSAIVASILTALFFLNFNNNQVDTGRQLANNQDYGNSQKQVRKNIVPQISQPLAKETTLNSSYSNKPIKIASAKPVSSRLSNPLNKSYMSSIPVSLHNNSVNRQNFSESQLGDNELFNLKNARNTEDISYLSNTSKREFQLTDNYYPTFNKDHSLTLCLNGISAVSFPNVNIESQSTLLSNISFGGYVPISKNFNIGLEVGQETFGQIFYNIENHQAVKYKQNPKLLWAGMGINYTFDDYIIPLANAQPFVHFTIASTAFGPFGKAVSGIQFSSDNGFGFNFGLQGSVLVYQNDNRFYSTEKFGFIYGMFMRF